MLKKKYKTYALSMFIVILFLALIMNFNFGNNLSEIYAKPMFVFQHILGV